MPAVTFSLVEFGVVWSALDLGPLPFPLSVPDPGSSEPGPAGERVLAGVRADVFARLAGSGVAIGSRLRTEWADLLTVLARPERSVDAVGRIVRPLVATAAAAGGVAAMVVQDRGSVLLGPI
jgi:hypothetical protein